MTSMDVLGDDELVNIFDFLNPNCLLRVQFVCSKWYTLCWYNYRNLNLLNPLSIHINKNPKLLLGILKRTKNLKTLQISKMTEEVFDYVRGSLTTLKQLSTENSAIGSFSKLKSLVNLESLSISYSSFNQSFSDINEFVNPQLKHLVIKGCLVGGNELVKIDKFTNLSTLVIMSTPVEFQIEDVAKLTNLKTLGMDISTEAHPLARMSQLETLSLSGGEGLLNLLFDLSPLINLSTLEIDSLDLMEFKFSTLFNLSKLTITSSTGFIWDLPENLSQFYLSTDDMKIDWNALSNLQHLKHLKLELLSIAMNFYGITKLKNLQSFDFFHPLVGDSIITFLPTTLTLLILDGKSFSDITLQNLTPFQSLNHLEIHGINNFTDEGITYLTQLKNLETIILDVPNITDEGCEVFRCLDKLQYVALYDSNNISMESLSGKFKNKDVIVECSRVDLKHCAM